MRANYMLDGNSPFYSHSLKLWERLERELNYYVMLSQRGQLMLCHSDGERDALARRGNMMVSQGDDAELLCVEDMRREGPYLDIENTRFPSYGGLIHRRAGTARHDAVTWGDARGANRLGVDLIQQCEVTGIGIENGVVRGVQTTRGAIRAKKVGSVVTGRSGRIAATAGVKLPIQSHVLQAFVTDGLKPVINHVISFGIGHFYISRSDKGRAGVTAGSRRCPGRGQFFLHLMATVMRRVAAQKFRLDRFRTGQGIMDEEAAGALHNLH